MNKFNTENDQSNTKINKDKVTSPINYPSYRSQKGNIAITSESNAELSRNWVEFSKL